MESSKKSKKTRTLRSNMGTVRSRSRSAIHSSSKLPQKEKMRCRSRSPITSHNRSGGQTSKSLPRKCLDYTDDTEETSSNASSDDESSTSTDCSNDSTPQGITKRNLQILNPKHLEIFYPLQHAETPYDSSYKKGWDYVDPSLHIPPLFNGMGFRTIIPIYKLSHITHADNAQCIGPNEGQNHFTFKPKCKQGRNGTYIHTEKGFVKIQQNENVLPGKFSWWEIDTTQWYDDDEQGQLFGEAVKKFKKNQHYLAHYLSNPRESRYGDHGFIVDFKELLKCYMDSRIDIADPNDHAVCLQICGTLVYQQEICYVVIVCTKYDSKFMKYPSLHGNSTVFDDQNLVDEEGKINEAFITSDSQASPHFQPQHVIKWAKPHQWCYETPAFAFYYPENGVDYSLKCAKKLVTQIKVEHYEAMCGYCKSNGQLF